jgi:hypothetical protein
VTRRTGSRRALPARSRSVVTTATLTRER